MGARLWHHLGPWRDDPAEALREVQRQYLREKYDYAGVLSKRLSSSRQALASIEPGDPYNLRDHYTLEVARLESLAAQSPPADDAEVIDRLRTLYESSGEGIGCVLDVTAVTAEGGMHVTRRLTTEEVLAYCGTDRPTLKPVRAAVSRINERLGRGDSVCFPVYAPTGEPVGWYFVGNTID